MPDFPGVITTFARGLRSKIAASTVVSTMHRLYTDEQGGAYVGDGSTQIKNLSRLAQLAQVIRFDVAQALAGSAMSQARRNIGTMRQTHVVVADDGSGDFTTIAAALAAYPVGNVDIYVRTTNQTTSAAGTFTEPATLTPVSVKNVRIRGDMRSATTINVAGQFINATVNCDQWTIENLQIVNTTTTNTDDCMTVDYPRRWRVQDNHIKGFGGDSIHFKGGIHGWIERNSILAKDSTSTNGHAGIHVEKSSAAVVPTTIVSRNNYVTGGVQYGLLFEYVSSMISEGDIAEGMGVGMRFNQCDGKLDTPYTEATTTNPIELFDSNITCVGRFRYEPVVTWLNVAAAERFIARIGRNWINPGKAIIFGGNAAGTDPTTSPSIRWGAGDPNGTQTGVVGSFWARTNGAVGTTWYIKESGTGNTGWTPYVGAATYGTPTLTAGGANGTSPPAPVLARGDDQAGEISFGSGTTPAIGTQVTVTFSTPYSTTPRAILVSANGTGDAGKQLYVATISTTGFVVGFGVAPTASQVVGTYRVEYVVAP